MNEVDHSTEIYFEIKPYDIDASGHVNNAVYINWLEDLRFKLFRKYIRLNDLIKDEIFLVVSSTVIKYKAPLFLFDKPKGTIKIEKYLKGIWYLSAVLESENRITTVASQKCVLFDRRRNRMIKKNIYNVDRKQYEFHTN
jgi:acyl-CoA thioester hydrolase